MTSSSDLPAAIPSLWRSLKLGYRAEPRLLAASFLMTLLAALPDALFALWLALLGRGVLHQDKAEIYFAVAGLGVSTAASWLLNIVGERVQRRFRDRATITIEAHVAHLQASIAGLEHHERPDYLDRLAVLRDQVFTLNHLYSSLCGVAGWVFRLAVTVALLMAIHPLLGLLAVAALPTVFVSSSRAAAERSAEERGAQHKRLARHLFDLATTASPGKEVRVTGIGPQLLEQRRQAWAGWYAPVARARWATALVQAAAWAVFGAAYVGSIVWVASGLNASTGAVLLVLAAGARLSQYLNATVGEVGFLRGIWLDASRRLAWLENYAGAVAESAGQPAPVRIRDSLRVEHLSFRYPATDRLVLEDINLEIPAGSVVAIVGENGAGKSTLVKLLCRFYAPSEGRITIDGLDIARVDPAAWRERFAGAFQDFFRFELPTRNTVGLGDLPRLDDRPAIAAAVSRAGAIDVIDGLSGGLETQLGPTWPGGVDLSFGQWQKLALARGFMRDNPLLLVLDEPTAALDAETEHALFERYAAASRSGEGRADGRITILVSHRFSTVRMADVIAVLDGAHLVEFGTHETLVANNGPYAQLYNIQAAAYR